MSDSYHSHGHSPAFIKSGYEFMQKIGQTLELPQLTIATGVIYYHRFFTSKNNSKIHPGTNMVYPPNKMDAQMLEEEKSGIYSLSGLIAVASIFLATKVEETPKKLKDVIIIAHRAKGINLEITSSKYTTYRTEVLNCEKNILQSMAFELTMEHPYKFLLDYIKKVCGNAVDQDTTKSLAQTAWNFVNDSLKTLVCLEYRPQVIAVAAIHMAATFHKVNISEVDNKPWYLSFNDVKKDEQKIDEKSIEEIRIKLMALYQPQAEPTRGNVMDMNAYKQMKNEKSPSTPQSPRTPSHSTPTTAYADTYPPQPTHFGEQKTKTEQEAHLSTQQENNHPPLSRPPSEPPKPQVPPSPLSRQPPPPNQPDKPPPPIKPEFSAIVRSITSPSRGESPRRDRLSRDSSPRRQGDRIRPSYLDDEADMRQKLSNSKDRDSYSRDKDRKIDDRSRSHEGSHERSREKEKNELYDRNDRRDSNHKKNDRDRDRRNDDRDRDRRSDDRDRDRDRPYEKRDEKDEFKDEPKKSHETRDRSYDREDKSRPYEKRDERENRNHNDRDRNHNDRDRNHNDRDDNRGSDRRTENRDKNRDWEDKKGQDRRDLERRNDREHERNHDREERDYHDNFERDGTRRNNASYQSGKPPPRRLPPQKRTSPSQDDRSSDSKRPRHS